MDQLYPIGTILSTHGYAGQIKVRISKIELKDCNNLQSFFLLKNDKPIPYFIEELRFTKENEAIIKLEDFDTKEASNHLKAQTMYIHQDEVIEVVNQNSLSDWLEYELIDEQLGPLGQIQNVFEYPAQLMIQIIYKNEEKLIPLHQDFIVEMNEEQKQIHVTLPEGILDI